MKESHSEGLASHTVPESCGVRCKMYAEALTGACMGRVLSREITYDHLECRRCRNHGRQNRGALLLREASGLYAVVDPEQVQQPFNLKLGDPVIDLMAMRSAL